MNLSAAFLWRVPGRRSKTWHPSSCRTETIPCQSSTSHWASSLLLFSSMFRLLCHLSFQLSPLCSSSLVQSNRECAATLLCSTHSYCAKLLKRGDAYATLLLRGTIFNSSDVGGATSVWLTTNHRFSTNVCYHHNLSLYSYYNVLLYHA